MNNYIEKIIHKLKQRKIEARFFNLKEDVVKAVIEETTLVNSVGIGGSITIQDLKLYEILKEQGKEVHWHWLVEKEKKNDVRQKAATADVYLTSTNGLTESGELINIDGVGNRVSAMFYGPQKVIVICGINKISKDINTSIERIKKEACPPNAKRLGLNTPCAITGECHNCLSEERMCNITTIISHKPMALDLKVFIVNDSLGY